MTAPPGPERAAAPGIGTQGGAETIDGESTIDNSSGRSEFAKPNATVDYGDVLTCVMAHCTGRPNCPWSPYTCELLGGES